MEKPLTALKGTKPRKTSCQPHPFQPGPSSPSITRQPSDHQNVTRDSKCLSSPQLTSRPEGVLGKEANGPPREGGLLKEAPVTAESALGESGLETLSVSPGPRATRFTGSGAERKMQVPEETKCVHF